MRWREHFSAQVRSVFCSKGPTRCRRADDNMYDNIAKDSLVWDPAHFVVKPVAEQKAAGIELGVSRVHEARRYTIRFMEPLRPEKLTLANCVGFR